MSINPERLDDFKCPNCEGLYFTEVKRIKVLSAIQSPNGQAGLVPLPAIQCLVCSMISDPLNPPPKQEKGIIL